MKWTRDKWPNNDIVQTFDSYGTVWELRKHSSWLLVHRDGALGMSVNIEQARAWGGEVMWIFIEGFIDGVFVADSIRIIERRIKRAAMMNLSELTELRRMLAETPEEYAIDRLSLKCNIEKHEKEIAQDAAERRG